LRFQKITPAYLTFLEDIIQLCIPNFFHCLFLSFPPATSGPCTVAVDNQPKFTYGTAANNGQPQPPNSCAAGLRPAMTRRVTNIDLVNKCDA